MVANHNSLGLRPYHVVISVLVKLITLSNFESGPYLDGRLLGNIRIYGCVVQNWHIRDPSSNWKSETRVQIIVVFVILDYVQIPLGNPPLHTQIWAN